MVPQKQQTANGHPEFNKDSEEGKFLDQLFHTAGVDGGLGEVGPLNYSPSAIKMLYPNQFRKFGENQFRSACQ